MSKVGRNEPCPCGSGRKYKVCCLEKDEQVARSEREAFNANLQERAQRVQEILQIEQEREELALGMQAVRRLFQLGQIDRAHQVARDVLMHQRGGYEEYEQHARSCIERGESREAIGWYEKAIEIVEAHPEQYFSSTPDRYRTLIALLGADGDIQNTSARAEARSDGATADTAAPEEPDDSDEHPSKEPKRDPSCVDSN